MAANDPTPVPFISRTDAPKHRTPRTLRRALSEMLKMSLLLPTLTFWITPELKDLIAKGAWGDDNKDEHDQEELRHIRQNMVSCWQNFALVVSTRSPY